VSEQENAGEGTLTLLESRFSGLTLIGGTARRKVLEEPSCQPEVGLWARSQLPVRAFGRPALSRALLNPWRVAGRTCSIDRERRALSRAQAEARRNRFLGRKRQPVSPASPASGGGEPLTREQAKKLLAVPDRSTPQGLSAIRSSWHCWLLCAAPAGAGFLYIQMRKGRWVIADLCGKDRRIRTTGGPAPL